jgi:hypothetical protein
MPRLARLRSTHSVGYPGGKTSSSRAPSAAGQVRFLGGTLVATCTVSGRSLTTRPTRRSLRPSP